MTVLESDREVFWLELSESEREEIELGIKQLDAGQRISLDELRKKIS